MDPTTNQAAPAAATQTAPAKAVASTASPPSLTTTAWMVVLCWPLIVGAATMIWTNKQSTERMETLIATRPDIAVVDDVALIKLAMDNGADRFSPASVIAEIEAIVKRNGMEDTILLSRSMIMYAPESKRLDVRSAPDSTPVRELKP